MVTRESHWKTEINKEEKKNNTKRFKHIFCK